MSLTRWTAIVALLAVCAGSAAADEAISPGEAGNHTGEEVTVEGRVVDVHCSPISCLLAFADGFRGFTAVIQASHFSAFPADIPAAYRGQRVRVRGKVEQYAKKPEITLSTPEQITVLRNKAREEEKEKVEREAQQREEQEQVAARLEEIAARIEELHQRMDSLEGRLADLVSLLERREAERRAAASAPIAPLLALPAEPPRRPAYQTLRSIKRGMTASEVEQLAGTPLVVDRPGPAGTTWYYGGGRSVTFDSRGRVQSLVGF